MKNILTVLKKELRRYFTDYRMILTLILPGVLIFVMYSIMGTFMADMMSTDEDYVYKVYVANQPQIFANLDTLSDYEIDLTHVNLNTDSIDEIKDSVKEQDIDLFIVYDADFETKLTGGLKPDIALYYNSVSTSSTEIYTYYYTVLYSQSVVSMYNVNANIDIQYDMATNEDLSSMLLTMLMPMLLTMLLFTGCLAIATESIAGEKERGTMATMLVTPVKRSHIAIGKIIALSITTMLSAVSSFLGTIFSLPKLVQEIEFNMSMYSILDYLQLFAVIVVTVLMFTVILSIVSCFAKSVKEASSYATPVMLLVVMCGFGTAFSGGGAVTNNLLYLIPVFNSTQCMTAIFSMSFSLIPFIITIVSNLVYVVLGVFILNKMFNSEKIMFNK